MLILWNVTGDCVKHRQIAPKGRRVSETINRVRPQKLFRTFALESENSGNSHLQVRPQKLFRTFALESENSGNSHLQVIEKIPYCQHRMPEKQPRSRPLHHLTHLPLLFRVKVRCRCTIKTVFIAALAQCQQGKALIAQCRVLMVALTVQLDHVRKDNKLAH